MVLTLLPAENAQCYVLLTVSPAGNANSSVPIQTEGTRHIHVLGKYLEYINIHVD